MQIIIKNVRNSYPNLFNAKEFKAGDGKPRWSCTFMIEKGSENDKAIRAAIEAEAKNVWGAKAPAMLKGMESQGNKFCYIDGDIKTNNPEYEGLMILATHRSAKMARPVIIDRNKALLTIEDGKPYAGCYVNAKVEIYCQQGENAGVRASFAVVQFAADGDAFSTGVPSADDFDDVSEGADADGLM